MAVTLKLLRTIRLDTSDTFVFERAAAAGEWAITGTFTFWDQDVAALQGRAKQAFRSGFLGLSSFGWSTLAVVVEASEEEHVATIEALATHLMSEHGAPDIEAAREAARDELAFAATLADQPVQTLVAVHRSLNDDGEISEQFRTFHSADAKRATAMPCSAGAFAVVEDEAGGDDDAEFDFATLVTAQGGDKS
jgi:Family of unknown function (DUF6505)